MTTTTPSLFPGLVAVFQPMTRTWRVFLTGGSSSQCNWLHGTYQGDRTFPHRPNGLRISVGVVALEAAP